MTTGTIPKPHEEQPRRRRRVKLDGEVNRGNPAQLLLGQDEQPARKHAALPPKPLMSVKRSLRQIERDEMAMDIGLITELEQYAVLCEARARLARAAIRELRVK